MLKPSASPVEHSNERNVRVVVIGAGSFIARQWQSLSALQLTLVPHGQSDCAALDTCDVVVNCALTSEYRTERYQESTDQDLKIARMAAHHRKRFVMLSTRKVYAPGNLPLHESSPLGPVDRYGDNKLTTEHAVVALLGERCTRLRISNVYGYELGRRSFLGLAMSRLKEEGRVLLDISPFVVRDFIAMASLARVLDAVCGRRASGLYNVGSGTALPLGRIAQWLVQGYGAGRIEIFPVDDRDSFTMDTTRLRSDLGCDFRDFAFAEDITGLGQRLAHE